MFFIPDENSPKTAWHRRASASDFVLAMNCRDWAATASNCVHSFPTTRRSSRVARSSSPAIAEFSGHSGRSLCEPYGHSEASHRVSEDIRGMSIRCIFRERSAPLLDRLRCVATHNHFVLDRGGKVFNRTAPIIKLAADATEDDHLALLGLLNSSTACFWMKQVFHNKGGGGIGRRTGNRTIGATSTIHRHRSRTISRSRTKRHCTLAEHLDALAAKDAYALLPEVDRVQVLPVQPNGWTEA